MAHRILIYNNFLNTLLRAQLERSTVNLLTSLIINTEFKFLIEYLLTLVLPGLKVKDFGSCANSFNP